MSVFANRIRPHVDAELAAAASPGRAGLRQKAFHHLEQAHVLAQGAAAQHLRVHVHMFLFALRHRLLKEALGQIPRLLLAAPLSFLGAIPTGNTGGSEVNGFQAMPVPADLQELIDVARAHRTRSAPLPLLTYFKWRNS